MQLQLDYNSQIYRLAAEDKFALQLASTLNLDGTIDSAEYNQSLEPSLADKFEYVMHGRIFKVELVKGVEGQVEIFASFGGLLMSLKGAVRHLTKCKLDMRIYILIRKTS